MRAAVRATTVLVTVFLTAGGALAQLQRGNALARGAIKPFQRGQIFVADQANDRVHIVDPITFETRELFTSADGLNGPSAVQFTQQNRLLVANFDSDEVMEFDASLTGGVVLSAADGLSGPGGSNGITLDPLGRVFVSNAMTQEVLRFDPDYNGGIPFADASKGLGLPAGLAVDARGDMLVASVGCSGVLVSLDAAGHPSHFDTLFLEDPQAIAVRENGDVYVLCLSGNLFRYPGGATAGRTLLGSYGVAGAPASLEFDPDSTVLYHVNSATGDLRTIDPDTGAASVVLSQGWDAVSMAVLGSQFAHGSFEFYGQSTLGSGGVVPQLAAAGTPRIDDTFTLQIRDFVGGAYSLTLFGGDRGDLPAFAGSILVDLVGPHLFRPLVLPGTPGAPGQGDVDFVFPVADYPPLVGFRFYAQHFAFDGGAPRGVAMSNAVCVFLGE